MGTFYQGFTHAVAAASCFWVLGCDQCPMVVNGMHNGDTIQTTIVDRLPHATPDPCVGLYDIVPGTTFTLSANGLGNGGEKCDDLEVSIVSSTSPPGSQAPAMGGSLVDASGCSGRVTVGFVSPSPKLSVFIDDPDGGPYQTLFWRSFAPAPPPNDGGDTCPIRTECEDEFVARNRLGP